VFRPEITGEGVRRVGNSLQDQLLKAGLVDKTAALVKVLANGELSKSLTVAVDKVSGGAKKKIEAAGGTVEG